MREKQVSPAPIAPPFWQKAKHLPTVGTLLPMPVALFTLFSHPPTCRPSLTLPAVVQASDPPLARSPGISSAFLLYSLCLGPLG